MSAQHARGSAFRLRLAFTAAALIGLVVLLPVLAGCGSGSAVKRDQLIVATTTSLKDSGLIDDVVLPLFAKAAPDVTVKVLAPTRDCREPVCSADAPERLYHYCHRHRRSFR